MRSTILSLLVSLALIGSATAASPGQDTSARALKVLEGTKTVTGDYALYIWNRITHPDQAPVEEWSAEFHSGHLHRVETPKHRIIANCHELTGAALFLESGEIVEGPQVAAAACGINTNASIIRVEWLGSVQTLFGQAQRVRVTDRQNVRQYDVSDKGVLLRTTYWENGSDDQVLLASEAVKLDLAVPTAEMFDQASLQKSFVPAEYKAPPIR